MDQCALKWMLTCYAPNECLMRWRLRLSEFDYKVVYRPGLFHQIPEALSIRRFPSDTRVCENTDNEIPTFDSSPVALDW